MNDAGEVSSLLDALVNAAEAAWPQFCVDPSDFRERLLASVDAANAKEQLPKIHAADLYLAYACARGLTAAQHELAARYLSRVDVYLRRFAGSTVRPEDVRREIEDNLLFGRGGSLPRIGQYTGRGPLDRFVAIAARNAAVTMLRAKRETGSDDLSELASQLVSPAEGSQVFVANRYESTVKEALRKALGSLDRRQRTIVRLHLQGITLTQIARSLHVHQTTVSRAFAAALAAIHDQISRELRDLEGMNESEMVSIVRDLRNRIDLSFSRILRTSQHG